MIRRLSLSWIAGVIVAGVTLGCDELPSGSGGSGGSGGSSGSQGGSATTTTEEDPFAGGAALDVAVADSGRVYVDLDKPAIVDEKAEWELAFAGAGVFTNGGASGSGKGAAFGPLAAALFLGDEIPEHPFLIEDKLGGAFVDWYKYDGAAHVLYSRYHVYGVRRGGEIHKLQILGYYSEVQGAPVSGIYSVRFARVKDGSVESTTSIDDIDATAGGVSGGDDAPSACFALASAKVLALTPAEAAASSDWDVCLRRSDIAVNGGLGGPGGVEAVDLDRAATAAETIDDVMGRTADSELARFDKVKPADLSDPKLPWRTDGVVSAFTDAWTEPGGKPLAPAPATWLVAGSGGKKPFLVAFESFTGATDTHPGTVRLRIKQIGGEL